MSLETKKTLTNVSISAYISNKFTPGVAIPADVIMHRADDIVVLKVASRLTYAKKKGPTSLPQAGRHPGNSQGGRYNVRRDEWRGGRIESGGMKTPTCPLFKQLDHDGIPLGCSETRTMGGVLCRLLELLCAGGATSMRLTRKPLARLSEDATRASPAHT